MKTPNQRICVFVSPETVLLVVLCGWVAIVMLVHSPARELGTTSEHEIKLSNLEPEASIHSILTIHSPFSD